MNQEMRQEIVTLARELPDELLAEALVFLHSLAEKAQNNHSDNSSTIDQTEFDKAMAAYQVISEKYKNALRELAQ
ncbi:hypothetical protein [Planktothrix rubescens]|uniref:hypothetical protein n=1 Tax=Planktothrix rubescens TaxID=59512 RepID=UPI00041F9910|nr:hypothetical protein [Planktothrix rubescens]